MQLIDAQVLTSNRTVSLRSRKHEDLARLRFISRRRKWIAVVRNQVVKSLRYIYKYRTRKFHP